MNKRKLTIEQIKEINQRVQANGGIKMQNVKPPIQKDLAQFAHEKSQRVLREIACTRM